MLTAINAADAAMSVHLGGRSVATSSPKPKKTADFIFCLWHFIISPSIIVYIEKNNVLEFSRRLYYDVSNKKQRLPITEF